MKSINYFLKKFGHKTFEEFPFNEVDSLIFCQISYLNLQPFVHSIDEKKDPAPYQQIFKKENICALCTHTLEERKNKKLLSYFLNAKRYQEMKIGYYCKHLNEKQVIQFSAVTFFFPKFIYVAYEGTDTTLIGWKEDFNLALLRKIPAQQDAHHYLMEIKNLTNLPMYIGGHSKGGNLAYYAALNAEGIHDRIIKIYNHDGPGFHEDIIHSEKYLRIKDKTFKIVPQDDVVGVLLNHCDAQLIIKCSGFSIMQHSPFCWKITKKGTFDAVKHVTIRAQVFDIAIKKIVAETKEETLMQFSDILFEVLGIKENMTTDQMVKNPISFLFKARKRYKALPKSDQRILKRILKKCVQKVKKEKKKLLRDQRKGEK